MEGFEEFVQCLIAIKNMGWVQTHRSGNTGIGKTLEDLLHITENNIPGPNAMGYLELKSTRKNAGSMITLFTKSPLPQNVNTKLRDVYGYITPDSKGEKILHTTLNAQNYNMLRGQTGFKIDVNNNRLNIINSSEQIVGYWDAQSLKICFERKLPNLMLIKADSMSRGADERFHFNEAWALANFGFDNFVNLVRNGHILIDIRLGTYANGRVHDHGTAFRTFEDKLDMCYEKRKRIM